MNGLRILHMDVHGINMMMSARSLALSMALRLASASLEIATNFRADVVAAGGGARPFCTPDALFCLGILGQSIRCETLLSDANS